MSDKDQFTFEDEDESPGSNVTKKKEPQEPDAGGGEIFFDMEEDLPEPASASRRSLRSPTKAAKNFSSILKRRIRSLSRVYSLNLIKRRMMRAALQVMKISSATT